MTLDVFDLPPSLRANVQMFTGPATVTNLQWQTWSKPRGVSMIYILCIGGGGGGGGGFTGVAGAARGGGAGGGSSGSARFFGPAILLPDTLFIQAGAGGAGGAANTAGSSGIPSYVTVYPDLTTDNCICNSCATAPAGGGAGTSTAGGTGGAGGTLPTIASMPIAGQGQFGLIAGQAGANGGAQTGAVGGSITLPLTGACATGGAGGAGVTATGFAGGGFNAVANTYLSEQRPATAAASGNNGSGGPVIWRPMMMFGGCGGSSNNAGAGGNGGNGAYGAGGAGGAGGTTGGSGGNGGAGLVVIVCW